MDTGYEPTPRTTPTRYRERARYDRDTVHEILDEALICHLGYLSAGRPVVLPTTHARLGESLYLHGSTGSGPMLAGQGRAVGAARLRHRHCGRRAGAGPRGDASFGELPLRGRVGRRPRGRRFRGEVTGSRTPARSHRTRARGRLPKARRAGTRRNRGAGPRSHRGLGQGAHRRPGRRSAGLRAAALGRRRAAASSGRNTAACR